MITIGVDAHKRVNAAVALDELGQELAQWRGANTADGWHELLAWASRIGTERTWGIEGAWGVGRGLAQALVCASEVVHEVNARLTAWGRRGAARPGKSDRLDAQAVARVVRQEGTRLPMVTSEDDTVLLDLWTTERSAALAEATRLRNQIHALLHHCDPTYQDKLPSFGSEAGLIALERYAPLEATPIQMERAASVRRLAARLRLALAQAEELAGHIKTLAAKRFTPLTEICGISLLTAGTLAAILGPGQRFTNDAAVAAYAGVAPLEVSSASRVRHRLSRGGNRQLNMVFYMIAMTQSVHSPAAKAYLLRRTSEGKSKREALRALKRFIVRAVWRRWLECHQQPSPQRLEAVA